MNSWPVPETGMADTAKITQITAIPAVMWNTAPITAHSFLAITGLSVMTLVCLALIWASIAEDSHDLELSDRPLIDVYIKTYAS